MDTRLGESTQMLGGNLTMDRSSGGAWKGDLQGHLIAQMSMPKTD